MDSGDWHIRQKESCVISGDIGTSLSWGVMMGNNVDSAGKTRRRWVLKKYLFGLSRPVFSLII